MICRECKHCKRLYVPPVPCFDHARTVRDRFVCTVHEDVVQYLGDDEGTCEMHTPKESKNGFFDADKTK